MAFIPFIPLVIQAAIGSARGIAQNRANRKKYDQYTKQYTDYWTANEKSRVQRAQIIQRIIDADPHLKEMSGVLGPDFWTDIMTSRPVPSNIFGDRPRGGFMGDLIAGHLGGLNMNQKDITDRFDQLSQNSAYPEVSRDMMGRAQQGSNWDVVNGGRSPFPGAEPKDPFGPGFDVNGNPTYDPLPSKNLGPLYGPSETSTGAPKAASVAPSAPPVLSGSGLRFDPRTGTILDRFNSTKEF